MTTTSTGNSPNDSELQITRRYDAPRARVFDVWRTAEHLRNWFFPREFRVVEIDIDFRSEGDWSVTIQSPKGNDYPMLGKYREIVDGERIVFTQAWREENDQLSPETTITVTFSDDGDGCEVVFRQEPFESAERRDSHEDGWDGVLEKLAEYLAN